MREDLDISENDSITLGIVRFWVGVEKICIVVRVELAYRAAIWKTTTQVPFASSIGPFRCATANVQRVATASVILDNLCSVDLFRNK
jgi:hypothetical protein